MVIDYVLNTQVLVKAALCIVMKLCFRFFLTIEYCKKFK